MCPAENSFGGGAVSLWSVGSYVGGGGWVVQIG